MNSAIARLLKISLRLQRPLLRRISHPQQLGLTQAIMTRAAILPAQASARRSMMAGVPVLEIRNLRTDHRPGHALVYVHGGGFASGSPDTHRAFAARLMQAGRFESVFMPQYRLAPAHPWPAALDDVQAFWSALMQAQPQTVLALAGESAGANLCLSLCLRARDTQSRLPEKIYLHSPWLDVSLSGDSYVDPALEDGFTGRRRSRRDWIHQVFARHYAGASDPRHPHMSPVFADMHGLPPLYVQTGAKELFLDDSRTLQANCHAAGTVCELEVWPGMWHAFALLAPLLPEANRAIRHAGRWLAGDSAVRGEA
ncbi:MAG: alpha/beta hydrolase [Moraxellaceae bacterium]|nr:alpha/beta hydrolase [Moraxellaceae bacterium]